MLPQHSFLVNPLSTRSVLVLAMAASLTTATFSSALAEKVSTDGKVVLANVDRHKVTFRVGRTQKDVFARKASVISPKQFPFTLELWTGSARPEWKTVSLAGPGIYIFRYQRGQWELTKHTPTSATSGGTRTAVPARPSYYRSSGTRSRVAAGGRYYARPPRLVGWAPIQRAMWAIGSIYRFIRDEDDRDLIRDIIIGREIDDAIYEDLIDRIDDYATTLPAEARLALENSFHELETMDEKDWQEIDRATDEDWGDAWDQVGDQVGDLSERDLDAISNDWNNLDADIDDVGDVGVEDIDIGDLGADSFDENIDLGDIEGGDFADTLDDVNVGDLGIDAADYDLSDLDLGGDIGGDLGGGGMDFGGGGVGDYDVGGGDFGWDGGGDFGGDFGGGFDGGGFDAGGFDDFGGGFDDFGGGFDF